MSTPHLVQFRLSHYNEKVRWALDHKKIAHTRETLIPGFHIPRVRWLTGQELVPVLLLDGRPVTGSATIVRELERRWPEPALIPEDPALRARAEEIERRFDDEVGPETRRLFWGAHLAHPAEATRIATLGASALARTSWRLVFPALRPVLRARMQIVPARLDEARARLPQHLDWLAARIGPSGYLAGERFGIADLTACALLAPIVLPPELSYPLPPPWTDEMTELRQSVAAHAAFRWVEDLYRRHRGTSSETTSPGS